jgi:AAA family ATP:ADP antiporter
VTTAAPDKGWLERFLGIFSDVRTGEGPTTLLFLANVFLVLVGYYVIKTVREPLVLATGGAELKSYAAAVQAATLVFFVPAYSWLASRVSTKRLLVTMILFFLAGLEVFFVGLQLRVPMLGFVFYVWVGIFSVSVIAMFWSFANEVHSSEEGERLFPVIGIGATTGAYAGSKVAEWLFGAGFSPGALMQLAAGILVAHLLLYFVILRRPDRQPQEKSAESAKNPLRDSLEGFALVFNRWYVALIAVLLILLNLVNSLGEYILGSYVVELADQALAQAGNVADASAFKQQYIGAFYGGFFSWVNLLGVALQALVASRLVKYFGIGGVLFALPIVSLGAYSLAALGVSFLVFRVAKTGENATDYSVMNTAKQMLWLPTSHEEKYKAKQAVDTFFVRIGDVLAAALVFVGTQVGLGRSAFAGANVAVVLVWFVVAWALVGRYRALGSAPQGDRS